MDRSRIALVIPALNESSSIGNVVVGALQYGIPVVVDDGSWDRTDVVATNAGADVVRHKKNTGYDSALNSGFRRAAELEVEWVVTLDADGQHDHATLRSFISELEQGADVVIGVRDRRQRLAEHMFAWLGRALWGIHDPLCGMKGYRLAVYVAHGCFDSCNSIGTELAIYAAVRGYGIRQVPVPTKPRLGSSRFGSTCRANVRILRAMVVMAINAWRFSAKRN